MEAIPGRIQFRALAGDEFQGIDSGGHVALDPVGPDELVDTVLDARRGAEFFIFGMRLFGRLVHPRPFDGQAIQPGTQDLNERCLQGIRVGWEGIEIFAPLDRHGRRVGDVVGE